MKKLFAIALALGLLSPAFAGDVLTLNNQMVFSGKVKKIKNCVVVFKAEGQRYFVPASEIFSLQFEDPQDRVYQEYLEEMSGTNPEAEACLKGEFDAEFFHGKKGGHFVLGVLFGPFAILGTLLANPTPQKGKQTLQLSQNEELFNDPVYLQCYKKEAKRRLIGMEALGWLTWSLFALLAF